MQHSPWVLRILIIMFPLLMDLRYWLQYLHGRALSPTKSRSTSPQKIRSVHFALRCLMMLCVTGLTNLGDYVVQGIANNHFQERILTPLYPGTGLHLCILLENIGLIPPNCRTCLILITTLMKSLGKGQQVHPFAPYQLGSRSSGTCFRQRVPLRSWRRAP